MSRTKQWTVRKIYSPAAVGAGETTAILNVKKGWRVLSCHTLPLVAAAAGTDTTITVGDGVDPDGFQTAIDLEAMTPGTPIDGGAAAYFASAGGKLYTVDDTIDAVYAGATFGATLPKVAITITIRDERY